MSSSNNKIVVRGAREHNLKNLDLELPNGKLIVFTGVSGSGKSSLVFDTIYAEGQRRYVESLSSYARQFLERINKPGVDLITGISPAVAIEQKTISKNTRSTVGTTTEVYDYLRLLFARIGKTYCYNCGKIVQKASTTSIIDQLESLVEEGKYYLGFPLHDHESKSVAEEIDLIKKRGFIRFFSGGKLNDVNETYKLPRSKRDITVITERFKIKKGEMREKLSDSIEMTFKEGENRLRIIDADSGKISDFNKFYECCGIRYEEPEPRFFSFNNPFGACPVCQGFGKSYGFDMRLIVPNPKLSILQGAIHPWSTPSYSHHQRELVRALQKEGISVNISFFDLSTDEIDFIKKGNSQFIGLDRFFAELESQTYKMNVRIYLSKYRGLTTCTACKGTRLRREVLQVKISEKSISDVVVMPMSDILTFFTELKISEYDSLVADRVLKEIIKRLTFLNDVGLGYLTLDRLSSTLSGGESQRINLATALGSALVGTLYVLDEPSIGLHSRDNEKLIGILKNLRDIGNTVLVVEHDPDMMANADLIVDMGPKAGIFGGEIIAVETYKDIKKNPKSLTGRYLSGKLSIPLPKQRRTNFGSYVEVTGARENNLKNISVSFPLNALVVVTGVSGSGKSTLVHNIIYNGIASKLGSFKITSLNFDSITGYQMLDAIEIVNQSPIGKTPRSNPISYIKAFEHIRDLFANTSQSIAKGFKPGYFSFNVPGGRCETCQGEGFITVEMQFLADVYLECEECNGTRFKKEIREITFRGKNLVDILNMSVSEAILHFDGIPKVSKPLKILADVGLDYIKLGQPANTLSGGEAQRIKLASHLSHSRDRNKTLFIFDEPTTGLHFDDIAKLLTCFNILIESGNSVLIIEHNLDVIKCADYLIDLGPEAGINGGEIVVTGSPELIVKNKFSHTARYLKPLLK